MYKESVQRVQDREKVKCFGKSSALTVEAAPLMEKGNVTGTTINLEVAARKNEKIDWESKIQIQLSVSELPIFASVCLGYLPNCEFKRPGKGIKLERQASNLYLLATAGMGNHHPLPIGIGDTFRVSSLVLKQLKLQTGLQDGELLLASLRGSAALYQN